MLNRSVKTWECGKLAINVEDLRIYEKEKVVKRKREGRQRDRKEESHVVKRVGRGG